MAPSSATSTMLSLNVPTPVEAIVPRFIVPRTLPLALSMMAMPKPAAGAGEAARLTRSRWPVLGLWAKPRSVEPVVNQVLLTAAMDQMALMIFAVVKDQILVRRFEPLSVKASETWFDEAGRKTVGG